MDTYGLPDDAAYADANARYGCVVADSEGTTFTRL